MLKQTCLSTSRCNPRWHCIAVVAVLFATLSSCVSAQTTREAADATLRADCRLAVQILERGHPAPKSEWALSMIYWCDESGGAVLGRLWTTPPVDSVAIEQLVDASAALLDQRVYAGVLNSARDAAAPRAVRLAALRVLCAFLSPTTVISPDDLAKPKADTAVVPLFTTVDHSLFQNHGTAPLPLGARTEIRDLFAALWRSDADPVIRAAGRSLSRRFLSVGSEGPHHSRQSELDNRTPSGRP